MSISNLVKRKLLASSGGYCGNPNCHRNLFEFIETGDISSIEELAHIIGQKEKGPRGEDELSPSHRDEYDNIILLCPTCHTTIDKNPHLYPKEKLQKWKSEHEERIKNLFLTPKFNKRADARDYVMPLFMENKAIFDQYGPFSYNAVKDKMATELEWERLSLQKIIPNNRKIESVVSRNQDLLTDGEYQLSIRFKLHREGFEYNKLSGDVNATVPSFPIEFEKVFK